MEISLLSRNTRLLDNPFARVFFLLSRYTALMSTVVENSKILLSKIKEKITLEGDAVTQLVRMDKSIRLNNNRSLFRVHCINRKERKKEEE